MSVGIRHKNSNEILLTVAAFSLENANLREAFLQGADLQGANLQRANLRGANLRGANLQGANLQFTNLQYANLHLVSLQGAFLRNTDLQGANLQKANLRNTDLQYADLQKANLRNTILQNANLSNAILQGVNLSGATGLLDASEWITKNLEQTPEGIICFKCIGGTDFPWPEYWPEPVPGAVLTETVNPCRTDACASGVNVATETWCRNNYPDSDLWECLIHWIDLINAVVPYNTDGKFRAAKVTLLERI